MHRFILCGAMALAPTAGLAQSACPDNTSLTTTGIAFIDSFGDTEIHRSTTPNIVVVTIGDATSASQNTLAHGVHVLQLADVENGQLVPGTVWDFSFSVATEKLPRPTPNGTWSATSTYTIDGDRDTEQLRHSWGGLTTFTLGACTLDAIPVRIDYTSESYDHIEELMYFPQLGTALLTVYEDDEGRDDYVYVDVQIP